ncbi:MAG TPA: DUF1579 family protein, partial [Candidatus Polarisedimenticolia bacterium]|nr:DUF1579 family protein [Candidatus Polarisedimenticolia bacterium]
MKTNRSLAAACLLSAGILAVSVGFALAAEEAGKPKPSPEHKKLGYFVGKWTTVGEMKPSPAGPGGKTTSTDLCNWYEGGFAVVCTSTGRGPMGPTKSLGILSYSTEDQAYTYYGVDSTGMSMTTVPKGTVEGNTWTYDDESKMGGKTVKSRYTVQQLSPNAYTFK